MRLADRLLLEGLDLPALGLSDEERRKMAAAKRMIELSRMDDDDLELLSIKETLEEVVRKEREALDQLPLLEGAVQEALLSAKVVNAQNVSDWIDDRESLLYEDLPSIVPPWWTVWAEWSSGKSTVGVLAMAQQGPFDPGNPEPEQLPDATGGLQMTSGDLWISDNLPLEAWTNVEFVWTAHILLSTNGGKVTGPIATVMTAVDRYGQALDITYKIRDARLAAAEDEGVGITQRIANTFHWVIAFMNLRNVTLEQHAPSPAQNRKHRRKRKADHDLLTFGTLRIDPLGAKSQGGGQSRSIGETRFHIARGGLRHYGDCCPGVHLPNGLLFGKLEGVYYVPAHVRGNPEHGVKLTTVEIDP